jgi:hypothetical protein
MYRSRIGHRHISRILIVLALAIPARAGDIPIVEGIPSGYELVRLTDDPTMEHSVPDINDAGEVVFDKFVPGVEAHNYRFSGGMIQQVSGDASFDFNSVINNFGETAWIHCDDGNGPFFVVGDYFEGDVSGEAEPVGFLDMNDAGDIAWKHWLGGAEYDIYLYTHSDGRVTRLTKGGNNQEPRINNLGDVAWSFRDDSVQPWIGRIMLYSEGEITGVTPEQGQAHSPDINDARHVVYRDGLANAVLFWDGAETTQIAPVAFTPRINNGDDISLVLWDFDEEQTKHAILMDGVIHMLPNFGFSPSRAGLNDRGEMAMRFRDLDSGHKDLFLLRRIGPKGDGNYDCRIDKADVQLLQICRTATPGPEGTLLADCIRFDFDDDGDVDPNDFEMFLDDFTGPSESVPECEPSI